MAFLALQILNLARAGTAFPDSNLLNALAPQMAHATWTGITAWDLIQPAFMFMVGVALPWSLANRGTRGESETTLWLHMLWRSAALVALGLFLRSLDATATQFTFVDVLAQIGLGYPVLFLLARGSRNLQWGAAAAILVGYWALFVLIDVRPSAGAVAAAAAAGYEPFSGLAANWNAFANPAHAFDLWFLNLLPRETAFVLDGGSYATLNFIPSIVTMLMGMYCGQVLYSRTSATEPLRQLFVFGTAALALGLLLHVTGICPSIKRLWTPAWVLVSGGLVTLMLAGCYWLCDLRGQSRWFEVLRIVGLNSLFMYIVIHIWEGFLTQTLLTHLSWNLLAPFSEPGARFLARVGTVLFLIVMCVWLHRRRIYLRL